MPNFSSLACVNGEIVQLELASFKGLYTVVVFYEVNTYIRTSVIHTKICTILFILTIFIIFIIFVLLTMPDTSSCRVTSAWCL